MITAASIINRSASGSAILPKADSTRQRRASQPSTWSLTPAAPKRIAAIQLWPPSAAIKTAAKTGISASRRTVSAFGTYASGVETAGVDMDSRIERTARSLVPICSPFATDTRVFPRYDQFGEEGG